METFTATLEIIGINPFVAPPDGALAAIFKEAGRDRGPIPVRGTVNGRPFRQTLVRYAGAWRLYINLAMLDRSPKRIGETIEVSVGFDPEERRVAPPQKFLDALAADPQARAAFDALIPSRRLEITRYLANLKSAEALDRNLARALRHLRGGERFAGRDRP